MVSDLLNTVNKPLIFYDMFLLALCPGLIVSIYWTLVCTHGWFKCSQDSSSRSNPLFSEFTKQGRNRDLDNKHRHLDFFFFSFFPPLTFSPDLTNRAHLTSDFLASYSILSFFKGIFSGFAYGHIYLKTKPLVSTCCVLG